MAWRTPTRVRCQLRAPAACGQSEAPPRNLLVHQSHATEWAELDRAVHQGVRDRGADTGGLGKSDGRHVARSLPGVRAMTLTIAPGAPERQPAAGVTDVDLD